MDTASLIIGLVLTLVCAVPLIYIANNQAKNRKKIKDIFSHFSQGKYTFSEKETHYKKIFALDKTNKGFLFVDLNRETDRATFIDLSKISSLKIENIEQGEFAQIKYLFKAQSGSLSSVVLYDLQNDKLGKAYWLENEQVAKKWQSAIENSI